MHDISGARLCTSTLVALGCAALLGCGPTLLVEVHRAPDDDVAADDDGRFLLDS